MKQVADIERRISQHVAARWAGEVAAEVTGAEPWWPRRYPLGRPDAQDVDSGFTELIDLVDAWRRWSLQRGVDLIEQNIRIDGVMYPIPSHIVIPDLECAARVAGPSWVERVSRGRDTAAVIDAHFPHRRDSLALTISATADWADLDVQLLCQAAEWFDSNRGAGLSPREVPLEGFHSKWLESRTAVVSRLAGVTNLGLLPRHPSRVHFTYLDPDHLVTGLRRHDSATVGDSFCPAYKPELVIICENKDTAIHFPSIAGAISVEGGGSGAGAFATFPWLREAPCVIYWGDMDADGLRILAQFRAAGIPARSLFMDMPAYERWGHFGTNTDKHGNPIVAASRLDAPEQLEAQERELWAVLTNPAECGPRRIEQERIPLGDALAAIVVTVPPVPFPQSGSRATHSTFSAPARLAPFT